MKQICIAEEFRVTDSDLEKLIVGCGHDLRKTLNNLQVLKQSQVQNPEAETPFMLDPFRVTSDLLNSQTYSTLKSFPEKLSHAEVDIEKLPDLITENYLESMIKVKDQKSLNFKNIQRATEMMAYADILR